MDRISRAASIAVPVAVLGVLAACSGSSSAPDAGPADAADIDAGACVRDQDCDNGYYCDGAEVCIEGTCRAAAPIDCDDGIACTTDLCSNERRECVNIPRDADGDGRADIACVDAAGTPLGDDCDDGDPRRFPGNVEICDADGHDEDCDPSTYGRIDADGDGFFDARCCNGDHCGTDCDDLRANVNPFASEACDQVDNDCNGNVDDGVVVVMYVDADGDDFGDPDRPLMQCAGAAGASAHPTDCDDANAARHPAQLEVCDGIDNDCDGAVDEEENIVDWYPDVDGDGFGDPNGPVITSCEPPEGHVLNARDCNDAVAAINPIAAELCDGIDNDCNRLADYRIGVNDFEDDDGDGVVDVACAPLGTDCDDADPATGPGTVEQCDGRDNDCDGRVDEGASETVWYRDNDGDGYGSIASGAIVSCLAPAGFSAAGGDCADADPSRHPGAVEACNGDDDDCDGAVDEAPAIATSCGAVANGTAMCNAGACTVRCAAGFTDCDGSFGNGCEAELRADPSNCGACGTTCNRPNMAGTCTDGACDCAPPFDDCDGRASNGCEVNTDLNANHCGGCGNFCDLENGLATCIAGACGVKACLSGWDDCDATPGCETDVTSVNECGACGVDCTALPDVSAVACSGRCEIFGCAAEFGNCDGDASTGCEASFADDPVNCGGCAVTCTGLNHSGACVFGTCECVTDTADCDDNPKNGCEVNTFSDATNCGGCGVDCFRSNQNGVAACVIGGCEVSCSPGFDDCGGDADPLTCETRLDTVDDCGSCGDTCFALNGNPVCEGEPGKCAAVCFEGWADCDAERTDCETQTASDPVNCGYCGNDCGAAGLCDGGFCDQVEEVAVGADFTCALRSAGGVACWGGNGFGQLGDGTLTPRFTPEMVSGLPPATALAAGGGHACAVAGSGLYCWGANGAGQLGIDTGGASQPAPQLITDFVPVRVSVGFDHSCAVTNYGEVWCWGGNDRGQLGNGTIGGSDPTPAKVTGLPDTVVFHDVRAGDRFTCANNDMGDIWCWGGNDRGQLGDGGLVPGVDSGAPGSFYAGTFPSWLAAGDSHGCLVRSVAGPVVECWGGDDALQLGDDIIASDSSSPVATSVADAQEVTALAAHSCAVASFGTVSCWGANFAGQLGRGSSGPSELPGEITALPAIRALSAGTGANHTCGVDNLGAVWCWGDNASGQIGVDATAQSTVPTPIEVPGI